MTNTKRGSKAPGFDYWGKRPTKTTSPGAVAKKSTRKRERKQGKKLILKETKDE